MALCSDNPFLHYIASVEPVFSLVSYVILIKMKQFVFLLFVFASSNSAKVENWSNPNLEGSLQPNSIKSSARNGKFLGTYGITVRFFLIFFPFFAKIDFFFRSPLPHQLYLPILIVTPLQQLFQLFVIERKDLLKMHQLMVSQFDEIFTKIYYSIFFFLFRI